MPDVTHDIVIVGAGIAGLTLARELRLSGHAPVVLERARGVGGRCATRRMDDQPVDHGVAFLHGHSPAFLDELHRADATRLESWPIRTDGEGTPCRPEAFRAHEQRVAFAEGVNRLPKHLAQGTDVRLESQVRSLSMPTGADGAWLVRLSDGRTVQTRTLALTIPAPGMRELLEAASTPAPAVTALLPLLALVPMVPCLAVLARYPPATPLPTWDMAYPRDSEIIHSISHDSSKRAAPSALTLVIQGRAAWSRSRLGGAADEWPRALLDEAARLYGPWAAHPASFQAHAWRKARVAPGCELVQPLLVELESGALLGCAGDAFDTAGGVEGAYLSGRQLASRIDAALRRSRTRSH